MKRLGITLAILVCVIGAAGASQQAPRQVVPAAASTPGLGGSLWQTQLTIHNPSEVPAEVVIELIPTSQLRWLGWREAESVGPDQAPS